MATPNYVTLVNRAIEEAGVDLASYASNGSDFNSTSVDKMMPKFKNWVKRAWRDIQQESLDWEFMSSTAEVNLDPGVIFYNANSSSSSVYPEIPAGVTAYISNIQDVDSYSLSTEDVLYEVYPKELRPIGRTSPSGKYWGNLIFYTRPQYMTPSDSSTTFYYPPDSNVPNISIKPNGMMMFFDSIAKFRIVGNLGDGIFADDDLIHFGADPSSSMRLPQLLEYISFDRTDDVYVAVNGAVLTRYELTDVETQELTIEFTVPAFSETFTAFTDKIGVEVPYNFTLVTDGGSRIRVQLSTISYADQSIDIPPLMIHSWSSYDFNEELSWNDFVADIAEIDNLSFRISELQGSAPTSERKLEFVPWESFKNKYDFENTANASWPRLVTEDNTGRWRFYPPLGQRITVEFDYQRDPQELSLYSDTPTGLDEYYADLIMWKAIMYFGEYDEQPSVFARAYKNYKNLLTRFEMQYREKFHFKPRRLY